MYSVFIFLIVSSQAIPEESKLWNLAASFSLFDSFPPVISKNGCQRQTVYERSFFIGILPWRKWSVIDKSS